MPVPTPMPVEDYPGYPLVSAAQQTLPWFFGGLPILIGIAWWWSRRPPRIDQNT
jgi:ABC-2 type transport system permease protein